MMTFIKEHGRLAKIKQEPTETVTVATNHEGLLEVLEAFERFLRGCGYSFQGHLEVVDYNDE